MRKLMFIITFVMFIGMSSYADIVTPHAPDGYVNGKPFQNLALKSGTVWAMQNIGAESAEEYGDYFAWGEVEPKNDFTIENYKYFESWHTDTAGNEDGWWTNSLEIENISGTEYDAARHNWGAPWRMPTKEEIEELIFYTNPKDTVINNVKGVFLSARYGSWQNHNIYVPASGYGLNKEKLGQGEYGYFWSGTQSEAENPESYQGIPYDVYNSAYMLSLVMPRENFIFNPELRVGSTIKPYGIPIRPVISREDLAKVMAVQGDADNIRIIYKDGNLKISNSTKEFAVSVVDLSGRTLYSRQVQGGEEIPMALSKGIYLITARNNTMGVKTAKVYVK